MILSPVPPYQFDFGMTGQKEKEEKEEKEEEEEEEEEEEKKFSHTRRDRTDGPIVVGFPN